VHSKLFACNTLHTIFTTLKSLDYNVVMTFIFNNNNNNNKSEPHCLHHMLPLHNSSSQMTLRPRGHSYAVLRVVYDLTKRSFILRSLYKQKSVLLYFFNFSWLTVSSKVLFHCCVWSLRLTVTIKYSYLILSYRVSFMSSLSPAVACITVSNTGDIATHGP